MQNSAVPSSYDLVPHTEGAVYTTQQCVQSNKVAVHSPAGALSEKGNTGGVNGSHLQSPATLANTEISIFENWKAPSETLINPGGTAMCINHC